MARASFTPPEGIENGVYVYDPKEGTHMSIDGKLVGRDINFESSESSDSSVIPREAGTTSAKFDPRWTGITCGSTILSSLDWASALQQLQGQCDGTTKLPKKNYYAIYGGAMAFMCNYAKNNICKVGSATSGTKTDMLYAYAQLDKSCSSTLVAQKSPNHMDGE